MNRRDFLKTTLLALASVALIRAQPALEIIKDQQVFHREWIQLIVTELGDDLEKSVLIEEFEDSNFVVRMTGSRR